MKLVYKGKTKDVYALEDGNYLLKFKDDVKLTFCEQCQAQLAFCELFYMGRIEL